MSGNSGWAWELVKCVFIVQVRGRTIHIYLLSVLWLEKPGSGWGWSWRHWILQWSPTFQIATLSTFFYQELEGKKTFFSFFQTFVYFAGSPLRKGNHVDTGTETYLKLVTFHSYLNCMWNILTPVHILGQFCLLNLVRHFAWLFVPC